MEQQRFAWMFKSDNGYLELVYFPMAQYLRDNEIDFNEVTYCYKFLDSEYYVPKKYRPKYIYYTLYNDKVLRCNSLNSNISFRHGPVFEEEIKMREENKYGCCLFGFSGTLNDALEKYKNHKDICRLSTVEEIKNYGRCRKCGEPIGEDRLWYYRGLKLCHDCYKIVCRNKENKNE